ncbi:MAG: hypothetical protein IMY80_02360 [Chloroflexi bacterium]|nr:hypothetical protein [Chloroflexota bacterium]
MKKRRWVFRAFGVLLAIVAVTVLAAIVLNSAAAESLPFSLALRSKLSADYSQDGSQGVLGAFRLSIIGDALRDLGLSPKEADQQTAGIKIALDDPVPTATALNFEGDDPYTPTSTSTLTPTVTNSPTNTPTNTPRPTKTPLPTSTKKPTKTPVPAGDNKDPSICCLVLSPAAGNSPPGTALTSCTINVLDLRVVDPAFSAGVKDSDVQFKYNSPSIGWVIESLTLSSGGFVAGPGSKWDAHYQGTINIHDVFDTETLQVKARVHDKSGSTNWVYTSYFYFTLTGVNCP